MTELKDFYEMYQNFTGGAQSKTEGLSMAAPDYINKPFTSPCCSGGSERVCL